MYSVQRLERLEAWFVEHESEPMACASMSLWVEAAMRSPREVAGGGLKRNGRGRTMYYSAVPGTGAMVTFSVLDVPVRVIIILSVVDFPPA